MPSIRQRELFQTSSRILMVRKKFLNLSQAEFCDQINDHLGKKPLYKKDKELFERIKFSQFIISEFENGVTSKKVMAFRLPLITDFLYEKYDINSNWIMIENNQNIPYTARAKFGGAQNIAELQEDILKEVDSFYAQHIEMLEKFRTTMMAQLNELKILNINRN